MYIPTKRSYLVRSVNLIWLNFQRCRCYTNRLTVTRCKACRIFYHLRPAHLYARVTSRYNYSRYTLGTISSACQTSETQYYVKSQAIRFLDAESRALREIQVESIIPTALFQ